MKTPPAGTKFGRLTFTGVFRVRVTATYRLTEYECSCACGEGNKFYSRGNLMKGHTTSCGCAAVNIRTKHGLSGSPEYKSWDAMIQRCTNPNNPSKANYFDRKIGLDPRWLSFDNFIGDMGPRPKGCTLERKDNNKGYWPNNCEWATRGVQNNNTRRNRIVVVRGETLTMTQACRKYGIAPTTVYKRLTSGMSVEKAITSEVLKKA